MSHQSSDIQRKCCVPDCDKYVRYQINRYCTYHQCKYESCSYLRMDKADYCEKHLCSFPFCHRKICITYHYSSYLNVAYRYCKLHLCAVKDCTNPIYIRYDEDNFPIASECCKNHCAD